MNLYSMVIESVLKDIISNLSNLAQLIYLTYVHNENVDIIVGDILLMLNKKNRVDYFENVLRECKDIGGPFWDKLQRIISHKKYAVYMKQNFWFYYILCKNETNIQSNFNKYTNNLFVDFDWKNCVVGGGSIKKMLDPNFEENLKAGKYNNSDIDIFLFGKTKTQKKKIDYIIEFLQSKFGKIAYVLFENVVNFYSSKYHIPIQVIVCNNRSPTQVITNFSLSHQQVLWDGKSVYSTINYIDTEKTMVTYCYDEYLRGELIVKTKNLGYNILLTGNQLLDDWIIWAYDNYTTQKPRYKKEKFFDKFESYNKDKFRFDPYLTEREKVENDYIKYVLKFNQKFKPYI